MEILQLVVGLLCLIGTLHGEPCPGGASSCATGMTCCLLPSGGKGCCPYANATCCADRVHCCPMGSTCDSEGGGHCRSSKGLAVEKHTELKFISDAPVIHGNITKAMLTNEVCGDGTQCPDETTCCPMKAGRFGCCPMPGAVCCSDEEHCCPSGTQCDQAGYCHQTGLEGSVDWKAKSGIKTKSGIKIKSILKTKYDAMMKMDLKTSCPGDEAQCPDGNTCCSVGEGEWGCCPMDHAVCCPDQQHCCPPHYHCLPSGGGCAKD